jgi:hypothetical protein
MKKSTIYFSGLFTIAIVATIMIISTPAFAYRGNPSVQGPNYSQERHELMTEVFESKNYDAWKELMSNNKGRVTKVINADNFADFAKAHELAKNGDIDGANEIRSKLGFGMRNGNGRNHGLRTNGHRKGFCNRQNLRN